MKPISIKTLSAISLGLTMQVSAFAGSITDINVSTLPNNQKIVKIKFDRDVVSPSGFVTNAPARIALDFPTTDIVLQQPVLEYSDSLLNQISTSKNKGQTRVVLSLNKAGRYTSEIKGNEVWVYVNEAPDVVANRNSSIDTERRTTVKQEQAVSSASVDFRKGNGNTGIVDVSAPSFTGTPSIKRQNDRIVITLKNYPLPTQAQRSLDVSDFSTPVHGIVLKRIGNDTEVTIKNKGNWDVREKVAGGRMSFEVMPKANVAEAGLRNGSKNKSFTGKRVSFDFQDVEVRTILQILAKESGMNIVASDSVSGKMTLSLKDVPWDQALDLVLEARNLDMRRQGNIINVAPRDELLAKDKATLQAQNEINDLGPLYSQTFQLKYKNVEEFRKILKLEDNGNNSTTNTILSKRGSALIDPGTNTLIITDNNTIIRKFQKLVEELDVPSRQVMVEARIVRASDGFSREIGVKFGYQGVNNRNSWGSDWANAANNQGTYVSNNRARANAIRSGSNTLPETSPYTFAPNISLPISSATSSIALVHSIASGALGLELQAKQAQNRAKTLSNPRVLTQDRKEAVIESGTEIPYTSETSSGATDVEFKKAVLGLRVTPQITPDGQIIMDIKINKDSVNQSCGGSNGEPCIDTNNLETRAMVEDGGTLVLGGIYEENNANGVSKVPLLGDIPLLGNLFKSRTRSEDRSELLIFITPRIMDYQGNNLRY
ncbi:MAG: type IV pilus secretin PilQ family protein [Neisseria sp.]|uniref:type IV pilus secretin PilQ family protein n=1 Tax=Neisseria sp. TaxID=192066 RepID=UPI0026DC7148|nr:type IV pilus secretin PilQ family protein [Neisseria sp.]MDO4640903.1 type IV pilus secretin PilQ family protein [Neisseria sp.]